MTMDKDGFIVAVVALAIAAREHGCMDIDGGDLQDLLGKHGLAIESPATGEDCKGDWGQEYGVELGDTVLHYHPTLTALMKERTG